MLVLRGGGNALISGEIAEEGSDLLLGHVAGMAFPMEEDVAANPIDVGLLGADAVVFDAQMPADAIEQFGRRLRG